MRMRREFLVVFGGLALLLVVAYGFMSMSAPAQSTGTVLCVTDPDEQDLVGSFDPNEDGLLTRDELQARADATTSPTIRQQLLDLIVTLDEEEVTGFRYDGAGTCAPPTATTAPTATSVPPTATTAPTATSVPPTATTAPTATSVPPTATTAPTATSVPPTATTAPTATSVPPTATTAPTATSVPPTATTAPTATSVPPTATTAPTATSVPPTATTAPTATTVPPTATTAPTATTVPPTATTAPTATTVPPTATTAPTATSVPPTATSVPPTATSVSPTATSVPPTATTVPPTATTVPPTATSVPPTATSVPPTATTVPPTATTVPPTPAVEPTTMGTVTNTGGDNLRCRTDPVDGSIIVSLGPGTQVELRGPLTDGWYPVRCAGEDGWVSAQYLTVSDGDPDPGATVGTVTNTGGDNLRCRTVPVDGSVITSLGPGTQVDVRGPLSNGWYPVRCAGVDGWVSAQYLTVSDGDPDPGTTVGYIDTAGGLRANCRSEPSLSGAIITQLPFGTQVTILDDSSAGWTPVRCANEDGWISSALISSAPPEGIGPLDRVVRSTSVTRTRRRSPGVVAALPQLRHIAGLSPPVARRRVKISAIASS